MSNLKEHPISDYIRQQQLEEESTALGIKRYRDNILKQGDVGSRPGVQLIERTIEPMSSTIQKWIDDVKAGKVRKQSSLVKFIEEFKGDIDAVSFIVARSCIGAVTKERALTITATTLGRKLEDELEYRQLAVDAPGLYHALINQLKETSHESHRRRVVMHTKNKYNIVRPKWTNADRIRLGTILINMFADSTNLISVVKVRRSKTKTVYQIQPTEMTTQWLNEAHSKCELLSPVHLPMVVPPRQWKDVYGGGYLNTSQFKLKLIKSRNTNYLEEISNTHMPLVYESVNTLQETPWKVNGAVLKVMKQVWEEGGTLGSLPAREGEPLPAKPVDIETNEEARTEWKRKAAEVHQANSRLVSKRLAIASKLWMAEKFLDEEVIYYVWTLDWRGRAYPLASFMHPQADDSGKALLQFAEGKPLGESGGYWLAVHIAGLYGVDKCSFDERVQWVQEHSEEILDSALNPLDGQRFWSTADKPWCALAACFEWLGFNIQGDSYVSHLPVSMDGSCNGLQNFSAMLKDEIGGEAVNLVPGEKPNDIYNAVRKVVISKLPTNSVWEGKVTRDLIKQPAMTYAYSASRFGMRNQLDAKIKKIEEKSKQSYLGKDVDKRLACDALAGVIYESIGEVVVAAKDAMDWLQQVARIASKDGLPIHWTTPLGFPVLQNYYESKMKRVVISMGMKSIRVALQEETKKTNRRKMASSIAPNLVHSYDSSHMMSTVIKCKERGITDFAMVHDSFGTHACNVEVMSYCLREAFIEQYDADVLEVFRQEIEEQLPNKLKGTLPDIPQKGNLDLNAIMDSEFFFA